MKYIISENKLEQLKNHFLNTFLKDNVSRIDSFIIINSDYEDDEYGIKQPSFEYDHYDGRLYVNSNIRNYFTSMFGGGLDTNNEFFKEWFGNRFNVRVSFVE